MKSQKSLQENIMDIVANKKPVRVIYAGEDFGIYHFQEDKGYVGTIGYIKIKDILDIVNGKNNFIEFREIGD